MRRYWYKYEGDLWCSVVASTLESAIEQANKYSGKSDPSAVMLECYYNDYILKTRSQEHANQETSR